MNKMELRRSRKLKPDQWQFEILEGGDDQIQHKESLSKLISGHFQKEKQKLKMIIMQLQEPRLWIIIQIIILWSI